MGKPDDPQGIDDDFEVTECKIEAEFGATQSNQNYSNVHPQLSVQVTGIPGTPTLDAVKVHSVRLLEDLRMLVHHIIDDELQFRHCDPIYRHGDYFTLVHHKGLGRIAVVSDNDPLPPIWEQFVVHPLRRCSLTHLARRAKERFPKIVPLHDPLSLVEQYVCQAKTLPALEAFRWLINAEESVVVLLHDTDIPLPTGYEDMRYCTEVTTEAMVRERIACDFSEATVFDCLDGDFTKLPDLPALVEMVYDENDEDADDDDIIF